VHAHHAARDGGGDVAPDRRGAGVGEIAGVDVVGQHPRIARRVGQLPDLRGGVLRRRGPEETPGPTGQRDQPVAAALDLGPHPRGVQRRQVGMRPRVVAQLVAVVNDQLRHVRYCASQVPIVSTVTAAPRSANPANTRPARSGSPAPWKVSATSRRPDVAWTSSTAGAPAAGADDPVAPPDGIVARPDAAADPVGAGNAHLATTAAPAARNPRLDSPAPPRHVTVREPTAPVTWEFLYPTTSGERPRSPQASWRRRCGAGRRRGEASGWRVASHRRPSPIFGGAGVHR